MLRSFTWERTVGLLLVELLSLLLPLGYDLKLHTAAALSAAPHWVLKIRDWWVHSEGYFAMWNSSVKADGLLLSNRSDTVALCWLLVCDNATASLWHKQTLHPIPPPRCTAWAGRSSGCHPACEARRWGCSKSSEAPLALETQTETGRRWRRVQL